MTRGSICNIKVSFKSSPKQLSVFALKNWWQQLLPAGTLTSRGAQQALTPWASTQTEQPDARQTRGAFVCLRTLKAKASIVCQHRQPWFILVPGRRVLFSQIPLFRSRRTHCSSFHFTGQADPVKYVTSYNGRIRKHPRERSD